MPGIEWRLYEVGFCTHPERATNRNASMRSCEYPALVAVLRHPEHGLLLFDTGYSAHFFAATARFPERLYRWVTPVHLAAQQSLAAQLAREGTAPDSVAWVVISHLHGDHVGGLSDFPQARMALSREAWDGMQARGRIGALSKGLLPALVDARARAQLHFFEDRPAIELDDVFARFGSAFDLLGDRSVLMVPLPGHADGHFGLLFEDVDGPVFLIADASWSSQAVRELVPPPALVTGWLGETEIYRDTLAKLHALQRESPRVRIVPAHCREWRPRAEAASGA